MSKTSRNLFDLTGDVAVVVGGTGVLGGEIAAGLAAAGAKIAVVGRKAENGAARVKAIRDKGGHAEFFAADAQNRKALAKARVDIEAAFGPATILVNAAGGNDPKSTVTEENPFVKLTSDDWQASFDMNVLGGAVVPSQEFGAGMVERKHGSIINIASVSAHVPLSRVVAYASAKAAVLNLTQFLAREWAPANVRVNSITPGFFPADQNRRLLFMEDGTPTLRTHAILAHTPMNRFGESAEIIGAAVFLASARASSFVTGIDLRVDGGFLSQTI
jgi:NAD(P)-dependent dehydrogenase (short-subunit alcohol dehydrogenase family)